MQVIVMIAASWNIHHKITCTAISENPVHVIIVVVTIITVVNNEYTISSKGRYFLWCDDTMVCQMHSISTKTARTAAAAILIVFPKNDFVIEPLLFFLFGITII